MGTSKYMVPSAVVMLLLVGCASSEAPPPAAPVGDATPPAAHQTPNVAASDDTKAQIALSDEIRKRCGISDEDAYFSFDSARVRQSDQRVLAKVAKCFTSGPLAGKSMKLVGRADPRGEEEYNIVLGGRRADRVKAVIVTEGLSPQRISSTSRGAIDAKGTDESSWAQDRRVDVMVGS
ncbi:MAG TPA: OmpA family protein [Polyangiaceae bacterium]|nr:OmpA family protein [Polyangiaceae bacterium]